MMSKQSCFMFIICAPFFIFNPAHCEDDNEDPFHTGTGSAEDRIDPHSFYYDRMTKTMIKNDVEHVSTNLAPVNTIAEPKQNLVELKSTDNQSMHEKIFYKRLVNMLLSNIRIQTSDDYFVTGLLSIEASHSQIKILENFAETESSLREIDAILSEVIKKPRISYIAETINFFILIQNGVYQIIETVQMHREATMITLAVIGSIIILRRVKCNAGFPIFVLVQIIFIMSFFMTWWQLIQEEEIELMAQQMQYSELPLDCQPDKMSIWHKFVTLFKGDDCKKYYEAMMANAKLRVTPMTALSHLVTSVIVHPASNVGRAVSMFIQSATDGLPWIYAWAIKSTLYGFVGIVLVILPFAVFGAKFSVGLGPLFRFGLDCRREPKTPKSIPKREPVEIIIKLPEKLSAEAIAAAPETKDAIKQLTFETSKRDLSSDEKVEGTTGRIETLEEEEEEAGRSEMSTEEELKKLNKSEKLRKLNKLDELERNKKDKPERKEAPKEELGGGDN